MSIVLAALVTVAVPRSGLAGDAAATAGGIAVLIGAVWLLRWFKAVPWKG